MSALACGAVASVESLGRLVKIVTKSLRRRAGIEVRRLNQCRLPACRGQSFDLLVQRDPLFLQRRQACLERRVLGERGVEVGLILVQVGRRHQGDELVVTRLSGGHFSVELSQARLTLLGDAVRPVAGLGLGALLLFGLRAGRGRRRGCCRRARAPDAMRAARTASRTLGGIVRRCVRSVRPVRRGATLRVDGRSNPCPQSWRGSRPVASLASRSARLLR